MGYYSKNEGTPKIKLKIKRHILQIRSSGKIIPKLIRMRKKCTKTLKINKIKKITKIRKFLNSDFFFFG